MDEEELEQEQVALNLMLEVYVKGREDSLSWPMIMHINRNVKTVAQVMDFAYAHINAILDSRSEDHVLLVDDRYNHHLIFREHLQVVSIQSPDQSSIPWGDADDEV